MRWSAMPASVPPPPHTHTPFWLIRLLTAPASRFVRMQTWADDMCKATNTTVETIQQQVSARSHEQLTEFNNTAIRQLRTANTMKKMKKQMQQVRAYTARTHTSERPQPSKPGNPLARVLHSPPTPIDRMPPQRPHLTRPSLNAVDPREGFAGYGKRGGAIRQTNERNHD